jgi:ATP-binding cassette subfamily B multidrug efflux pump
MSEKALHHMDLKMLRKLLAYLKPYKWILVVSLILLIIAKLIEAAIPLGIGKLSKSFLQSSNDALLRLNSSIEWVLTLASIILFLLFTGVLCEALSAYIRSYKSERALFNLRLHVFEHILLLPLRSFDRMAVGRLMTRTIHDVDQISQLFSGSFVPIIANMAVFLCMFAAIFIVDWRIALGALFLLPFVIGLTNHFRIYQRIYYGRIRSAVAALNVFVQEHLGGMNVVRSFGLLEREKKNFDELNQELKAAHLGAIHNFSLFISGLDFFTSCFYIGTFALLALTSSVENFSYVTFLTMSLYGSMIFRPLADLAERYNLLQSALSSSERIFDILEEKKELMNGKVELLFPIESISFENVWFAYEGEKWILRDVSFEVKKGEKVAFVGQTGVGKSTIFSLLLGFYDINKGAAYINGKDIRLYSKNSLRKAFSLVLQDPVIFSGTIKENITLFDSTANDDSVLDVLHACGLDEMLERFPKKLHEMLLERGKSLSYGEMQLLSIARAIYFQRPVFLLDEAMGSISYELEEKINRTLEILFKNKTTLAIAHRHATTVRADRIYVLLEGKIAEEGNHDILMKKKGIYENLTRFH